MSDGIPFGANPASLLDGLSPDLIARLLQSQQQQAAPSPVDSLVFDRAGMGAPDNGFSGSSGTIVSPQPPQVAQGAPAMSPQTTGTVPQTARAPAGDEAPAPVANATPAGPASTPPVRPSDLSALGAGMSPGSSFDPLTGQPVSGSPKPVTAPPPAQGSGGFDLGGALRRMNQSGLSDQLIAIAAGILQGGNFGEGLGRGFQNALSVSQSSAKTDLERAKLAREQAAYTGNAQILKRAYPNLSDAELAAMATNSGNVTTALQILRDPTHGMPKTPEQIQAEARAQSAGTMEGGAKPLDRIQAEAQAQSAGTMAGNVKPLDRIEAEAKAQSAGAAAGKPDETYTQLSEADRVARGLPPGAYQVDSNKKVYPIGQSGVTVNLPPAEKAEQAKIGEARGNVVADQITAGKSAQDRIRTLDQMSGALAAAGGNITTGPLGEPVLRAKQALGGILGRELPGTSATEMFNNMGPILAGEAARAITNRPAQIEFTTMLNSKPGLMNSVEGNRAMMDVMRQRAVQDADLANIAARSNSTDEYLHKKDEYEAAHPMINPFTGQAFGANGGSAAGATSPGPIVQLRTQAEFAAAPSGTRFIAPDGKLRVKP